jgi:hypothetical protein
MLVCRRYFQSRQCKIDVLVTEKMVQNILGGLSLSRTATGTTLREYVVFSHAPAGANLISVRFSYNTGTGFVSMATYDDTTIHWHAKSSTSAFCHICDNNNNLITIFASQISSRNNPGIIGSIFLGQYIANTIV